MVFKTEIAKKMKSGKKGLTVPGQEWPMPGNPSGRKKKVVFGRLKGMKKKSKKHEGNPY